MATITDDIGVWNNLGTVAPTTDKWLKFPTTATGANATLRVSYVCADWTKLNSYILIRPQYQTSNSLANGTAIRLYPENVSTIIELPIPQDLQDRSVYFRNFEVKKVLRWRRKIGITPDSKLDVKLEELWG